MSHSIYGYLIGLKIVSQTTQCECITEESIEFCICWH